MINSNFPLPYTESRDETTREESRGARTIWRLTLTSKKCMNNARHDCRAGFEGSWVRHWDPYRRSSFTFRNPTIRSTSSVNRKTSERRRGKGAKENHSESRSREVRTGSTATCPTWYGTECIESRYFPTVWSIIFPPFFIDRLNANRIPVTDLNVIESSNV